MRFPLGVGAKAVVKLLKNIFFKIFLVNRLILTNHCDRIDTGQ
jgi:hypothetical protein